MKKTIICNIPMKAHIDKSVYISEDNSIPASDRRVSFPVNAFIDAAITETAELKVILLAKEDEYSAATKNIELFKSELAAVTDDKNVSISYAVINTAFSEDKTVHEQLMGKLVDEIEVGSHLIVDITYGPKDLPIIEFTALSFAEKYLECEIDNILYGQSSFSNGAAVNTKICDMAPLFYLGSVADTVHADTPDKARRMLKSLLSL